MLIKFGTEEQKAEYLPKILNDEQFWCQGYSEPGAGSDLASVRTTAVREGDHYVVNGQKTWTTYGHFADWIFLLARTDPKAAKPQEGISFLLCDMATPGIEVRPIYTLEGEHEVNEVYLTDVKIPVENLVGEENKGWTVAKYLLTFERTGIAGVGYSKQAHQGRQAGRARPEGERPVAARRPALRGSAGRGRDRPQGARGLQQPRGRGRGRRQGAGRRELAAQDQGHADPPGDDRPVAPRRRTLRPAGRARSVRPGLERRAAGPGLSRCRAARSYFNMRKQSIYGGSNEIQRNIVAKALLGL